MASLLSLPDEILVQVLIASLTTRALLRLSSVRRQPPYALYLSGVFTPHHRGKLPAINLPCRTSHHSDLD
jgi:hypothetical protein